MQLAQDVRRRAHHDPYADRGREIVFHRCAKCEANTGRTTRGVLTLDEVLELARVRRYALEPSR